MGQTGHHTTASVPFLTHSSAFFFFFFNTVYVNISCDGHVNLLHSAKRELSGSEEKLISLTYIITQPENKAELGVSEREVQRHFQDDDHVSVQN